MCSKLLEREIPLDHCVDKSMIFPFKTVDLMISCFDSDSKFLKFWKRSFLVPSLCFEFERILF